MEQDLSNYRASYDKQVLLEKDVDENPHKLFQQWFNAADEDDSVKEANAMTLSTIGLDGFPKSRVVLLKKITDLGFIFYTNYESEKGQAIEQNSKICISFFWEAAERQIIIKGNAVKISAEESDKYFKSRPRGSQLGALVSHQSEVIDNRQTIEDRLEALTIKYENEANTSP